MISLLILWSPWTIIFIICLIFLWSPRLYYVLLAIWMTSMIFSWSPGYCVWSPWYFYALLDIFMISLLFLWSPWHFYDLLDIFMISLAIFMICLIFSWSPWYFYDLPCWPHWRQWGPRAGNAVIGIETKISRGRPSKSLLSFNSTSISVPERG